LITAFFIIFNPNSDLNSYKFLDIYFYLNLINVSNRLEDLELYKLAESFSDDIWFIVLEWDHFAKDTLGKQLVRAADSIGATSQKVSAGIILKRIKISVILAGVAG
jgi:hypothetical protein